MNPIIFRFVARLFVPGIPQPGGSKKSMPIYRKGGEIARRANGSAMINTIDDNPKAKDWKSVVAMHAAKAFNGELLRGTLRVTWRFVMPRLKGHYGSGRNAGALKNSAPHYHTVTPDLTKLIRSTEDACTGVLWTDDATIGEFGAGTSKVYGDRPGVEITVEALEFEDVPAAKPVPAPLFAAGGAR